MVLNLFDQETVTSVYPNTAREDVPVSPADILAGYDYAALLADLGPSALDVRYRMDNGFQRPRELRFTLKFEF